MVDSTIAHRPDFVNPAAPLFPDGWFRYASPADMPRETVDEFFECVIDVSASEEEAFLRFLSERGLSLFVSLQEGGKDWRLYWGDTDNATPGFVLTLAQMMNVCEAFWGTMNDREVRA